MNITIAGFDRTSAYTPEELEQIELVLEADGAEAGIGSCPVPSDDPTEEAASGQQFLVEVGAVTILEGFVGPVARDRAAAVAGTRQTFRYTVVDQNAVLNGHRAVSWVRPAETDRARMLAAIDEFLGHLSLDTSMVLNTNNETLPAKTYMTEDVFDELQSDCGDPTAKIMFVENWRFHWHRQSEGDAAGLEIVGSGANRTTTFSLESASPPQRSKDGMDLITDVLARNPSTGVSYQTDDPTAQALHDADGLRHQRLIEQDGASLAQLTTLANRMLATYKSERVTYEGTIGPLSAAQVALIPPGSLITVTDPVWGLTSSVQRIAGLRLKYRHPDRWLATLQLGYVPRLRTKPLKATSTSSVGSGTDIGGSGANPCAGCPPFTGGATLDFLENFNHDSPSHWYTGTTDDGAHNWGPPGAGGGRRIFGGRGEMVGVAGNEEESDTTDVAGFTDGSFRLEVDFMVDEYADAMIDFAVPPDDVFSLYVKLHDQPPTISGVIDFLITNTTWQMSTNGFSTGSVAIGTTLAAGQSYKAVWTVDRPNGQMTLAIGSQMLTTAATIAGSIPRYLFVEKGGSEGSILYWERIAQTDLVNNVPSGGQQVNNESVGTGNGSQTTFTTAYPWRAGGIVVRINGIDVTDSVTTFVPTIGDITFATAPATGSEITASYVAGP